MFIAAYNIFNEAQYLEESLKAIKPYVDYIVVIDGAYKNYPHKKAWSTDGSTDIASRYADMVIIPTEAWPSEIYKRNQYLIGHLGDTYIVLDGHEIWEGDFRFPIGDYYIREQIDTDPGNWHRFFQMFNHRDGIQYYQHHYKLIDGMGNDINSTEDYQGGYFIHKTPSYTKQQLVDRRKFFTTPMFDRGNKLK
jgi:hypothetical protein